MRRTILAGVVLVLIAALPGNSLGVTCTLDQRPAATLLVPWFQVTFNPDGSPRAETSATEGAALDTIVTIGNASSAPTIGHVCFFNERSTLVLDFNVALTGFDVQAMRISDVLAGNLPTTPVTGLHERVFEDVCQRNPAATVYRDGGFLRVRPGSPTAPEDNTLATALYPTPAFAQGGAFQMQTLDSLDSTADSLGCNYGLDGVISGLIHGYITIDMVNYCNLSNPSDPLYYANDAIGMENNLWGEVIYTSSVGVPAYGGPTVAIEADRSFSNLGNGGQFDQTATARTRTYYARYWSPLTESFCTNCGSGNYHTDLALDAPWDRGFGDEREPLGLKYLIRFVEDDEIHTNLIGWRASATVPAGTYPATFLKDLTTSQSGDAGFCSAVEPTALNSILFDEDENNVTIGPVLPSPIPIVEFSDPFPRETQRVRVTLFHNPGSVKAGWISVEFRNLFQAPSGTVLDQAWLGYEITGPSAFLTAAVTAVPLDPSTCNPLGVPIGAFSGGVNGPVVPVIPGGTSGSSVSGPPGTGPNQ